MTSDERGFVRAVLDIQTRYEILLEAERMRADKYASTIAERDQQLARLADRMNGVRTRLSAREEQVLLVARRNTELAQEVRRLKARPRKRPKPRAAVLPAKTLADRFWAKTDKLENGCWEWRGAWATRDNNGRLEVGRKSFVAHRLAFTVAGLECPPYVRRTCGFGRCVNPEHWVATDSGWSR